MEGRGGGEAQGVADPQKNMQQKLQFFGVSNYFELFRSQQSCIKDTQTKQRFLFDWSKYWFLNIFKKV
jgi:hypothetical protein